MSIVNDVWASDRRIVGITLQTPFTNEEYQMALARVRTVLEREGGLDNAKITVEARPESRPGWLDIKATWEGFIAPSAEKSVRIWKDADSSYGRERVVLAKLHELAKDMTDKVSRAKVEKIIEWMEIP